MAFPTNSAPSMRTMAITSSGLISHQGARVARRSRTRERPPHQECRTHVDGNVTADLRLVIDSFTSAWRQAKQDQHEEDRHFIVDFVHGPSESCTRRKQPSCSHPPKGDRVLPMNNFLSTRALAQCELLRQHSGHNSARADSNSCQYENVACAIDSLV